MLHFARKLRRELEVKIRRIDRKEAATLERSREALLLLGEAFNRLKTFILTRGFRDAQEEVYFFKHIKPMLSAHLIYRRKVYDYELNRPVGGKEVQQAYLNKALARIEDYREMHREFYRYYRSGSSMDDARYFLRSEAEKVALMGTLPYDRDPQYATAWDEMAAQVMAGELLAFFLEDEQKRLDGLAPEHTPHHRRPKKDLECGALKIHVMELALGLHAAKLFPEAHLRDVVDRVEEMTGVHLGNNLSRSVRDLRDRDEPAPFLNGMLDSYHKEINRPRSRRKNNNNNNGRK